MGIIHLYKEMFIGFKEFKIRFSIKFEWNTLLAKVVDNMFCLVWQDNNIVLVLSNIYIVYKTKDFRERVKKRLIKILINKRII